METMDTIDTIDIIENTSNETTALESVQPIENVGAAQSETSDKSVKSVKLLKLTSRKHAAIPTVDKECCICYEPMLQGQMCTLGCKHSFHCTCIRKWLLTDNDYRCPICRTALFKCTPSIPLTSLCAIPTRGRIKWIQAHKQLRPGMTLSTSPGGGVRVERVMQHDAAAKAGIKVGDVILYMNDVPCHGHTQAVCMLEAAFEHMTDVRCVVKYTTTVTKLPRIRWACRPFSVRGRAVPTSSNTELAASSRVDHPSTP